MEGSVSTDRLNRNLAIDKADWEWLVAEATKQDRSPAAELRRHLHWAIKLRKKGLTPDSTEYYEQVTRAVREQLRTELLQEMREDLDTLKKALIEESLKTTDCS